MVIRWILCPFNCLQCSSQYLLLISSFHLKMLDDDYILKKCSYQSNLYVYLDRKRSEIWPKEILTWHPFFPLCFRGGFKQMVGWFCTMPLSCVLPSGGMWHHHPVLLLALFELFHDNYVNVTIFISTIGANNRTSMLLYEAITPFSHLSTQELHYYLIKQCDCTIIN